MSTFPELGGPPFHAIFIRPPVVSEIGPRAIRLAQLDDGSVVAVRQDNAIATAFHPELTGDLRFHDYFTRLVAAAGTSTEGSVLWRNS